ncbi:MAG TPA: HlyD family secretion protein, partial [Vibrio sp.]|nr:HlyD family secretion protein [Vibrio sp.]
KVYLMDDNQRLQVVNVEVLYRRDNQVVVSGELQTGDKLVLNDVLPA